MGVDQGSPSRDLEFVYHIMYHVLLFLTQEMCLLGFSGANTTSQSWFKLPAVDPLFVGRDKDLAVVAKEVTRDDNLFTGPIICLVAPAGAGKTALALTVGHQLWQQAALPGGALFVDLREAKDEQTMFARFCSGLGIAQVSNALLGCWAMLLGWLACCDDPACMFV